jgi:hypothetical protein
MKRLVALLRARWASRSSDDLATLGELRRLRRSGAL